MPVLGSRVPSVARKRNGNLVFASPTPRKLAALGRGGEGEGEDREGRRALGDRAPPGRLRAPRVHQSTSKRAAAAAPKVLVFFLLCTPLRSRACMLAACEDILCSCLPVSFSFSAFFATSL